MDKITDRFRSILLLVFIALSMPISRIIAIYFLNTIKFFIYYLKQTIYHQIFLNTIKYTYNLLYTTISLPIITHIGKHIVISIILAYLFLNGGYIWFIGIYTTISLIIYYLNTS
jgi:hypothetical protein